MGRGHDLSGEMEPFAEVVEALWGEGVVIPLPGELGFEVAAGGEGLAGFDYLFSRVLVNGRRGWMGGIVRRDFWCRSHCVWVG